MSNIYIQEPPCHGKVLLETSVGDIEIELWSRECPKAARNFVQLCMENYYAKTKFHRVIKDFIVQGGDPTGTGHGGESIYGTPFKDEFHSRLRFCRRGLVAMANSGKDDNGSQFFITMGPTQELQNKHTVFGKVVGDTVYNMLRLQEGIVEDDKPINPHKILKTKVLINPFKDIKPRETIELIKEEDSERKSKKKKSKMKATKDYKLLSFGDEAEDEEEDLNSAIKDAKSSSKSAHDLLDDPKLLRDVGEEFQNRKRKHDDEEPEEKTAEEQLSTVREKLKKQKGLVSAKTTSKIDVKDELQIEHDSDQEPEDEGQKKREDIRREIRQLQKDLRKPKPDKVNSKDEAKDGARVLTEEEKSNDMLREFHEEQEKAKKAKVVPKKGSSAREAQTLAMLEKFQQKLHGIAAEQKHDEEDDEDNIEGDSWMSNPLKFQNDDPILAKDANTKDDDWFDIYDPRNPLNKRRRNADAKRSKK